jgi:hypothetical protein
MEESDHPLGTRGTTTTSSGTSSRDRPSSSNQCPQPNVAPEAAVHDDPSQHADFPPSKFEDRCEVVPRWEQHLRRTSPVESVITLTGVLVNAIQLNHEHRRHTHHRAGDLQRSLSGWTSPIRRSSKVTPTGTGTSSSFGMAGSGTATTNIGSTRRVAPPAESHIRSDGEHPPMVW